MYEHGLLFLVSLPPGAKVKRNEFAVQLNRVVIESSREISSESARRLLNFLASDDGHHLVSHVAAVQPTLLILPTSNGAVMRLQLRLPQLSLLAAAAVAPMDSTTTRGQAIRSDAFVTPVPLVGRGDPAVLPFRAVVTVSDAV